MTTNREWLYSLDIADLSDWFDSEHVENPNGTLEALSGIADAISSDSAVDDSRVTQNAADSQSSISENSSDVFTDSREKLEDDMAGMLQSAYMLAWQHGYEDRRGGSFKKLHGEFYYLLDRQAEITDAEWEDELNQLHAGYKPIIAELTDELSKRDKGIERLKRQRDEAREELRSAYGYMLDVSDSLRAEAVAHER